VGTEFLGALAKLLKATVSSVIAVRPSAWNSWAPTGRILKKFEISDFLENSSRELNFH
jgi:hypothetical protein